MGLQERVAGVGGGGGQPRAALAPADLAAYGLTPELQAYVRTLNYSTFRDYPTDQLVPLMSGAPAAQPAGAEAGAADAERLSAWQVRHATLLCQAVQEVNELRFVLCPK